MDLFHKEQKRMDSQEKAEQYALECQQRDEEEIKNNVKAFFEANEGVLCGYKVYTHQLYFDEKEKHLIYKGVFKIEKEGFELQYLSLLLWNAEANGFFFKGIETTSNSVNISFDYISDISTSFDEYVEEYNSEN